MTSQNQTQELSRTEPPCPDCGWDSGGELWPTHGKLAVKWIEKNLILPEGDTFGQPFLLRADQKKFLWEWYSYCGGCGYWRYTEGVKGAATGDGKTSFIAAIAILEFAGPPQIRPNTPIVCVAAVSWDQANELFRKAGQMVGGRDDEVKEAPLCGLFNVFDARIVYKDGRPGMIERVAAVAGTNEGGLPTLLLCDEVHEWGDVGSNKARLMTVIGKSCTKRKTPRGPGRVMSLSTAGFDMYHSLLGKIYQRGKKAQYNPHDDPKFLFDWREGDPSLDPEIPEDRRKLVTQASKAAGILWDVDARVRAWRKPDMPPHEWLRYYANRWVDVAEDSWLVDYPSAWNNCKGEWESLPDNPFTVAVDMSLKQDTTAVVRCEKLMDGRFAVTVKVWRAHRNTGVVDYVAVWDYIREIARGTSFRGVVYDPKYFEVQARLLEDEGYLTIQMDQNPSRMAPACGLAYRLILDESIVHDGDPDFADQVKAASAKPMEQGGFVLRKGISRRNIDSCIAMVMAVWELEQRGEFPPAAGASPGGTTSTAPDVDFWRPKSKLFLG